jgi:hypothetical protein
MAEYIVVCLRAVKYGVHRSELLILYYGLEQSSSPQTDLNGHSPSFWNLIRLSFSEQREAMLMQITVPRYLVSPRLYHDPKWNQPWGQGALRQAS